MRVPRNADSNLLERVPLRKDSPPWLFGPRQGLRSVWVGKRTRRFYVDRAERPFAEFLRLAEESELLKRGEVRNG
jgi:hypothetical protein